MTIRGRGPLAVRRGAAALLALALALAATGASCRPAPTLTVANVIGNLNRPWDIAFTPKGSLLFTERVGRINGLIGGQRVVLHTPADVVAEGEGGMMGLAVDPGFNTNRRIYACFLSDRSGSLDVRIARWRMPTTNDRLVERVDILTGIPANPTGRHSGCRIRFGPDGYLWVGTGDAAVGTNPQDPNSLGGKVLRITTSGAPAPGNAGAPFRPEIYTFGHRNVQGLAFAADGKAYSIEHGSDRDDEVNLLVRRGNYGWDPVPGYNESVPMTDRTKFPNARVAIWRSGASTIAPSGGTFLRGSQWLGWNRALAMAVLKDHHLRIIGLTPNGLTVEQQWVAVSNRGRLRVAVQGPNGSLYIATDATPGNIWRITPRAA
jgi:glucose/arabinose dehydrogenase